jgi:hypothetical protein
MPTPAIIQAMIAPATPVADPNRAGREKTPAPIIEPTTMAVSVGRVIFAEAVDGWVSTLVIMPSWLLTP